MSAEIAELEERLGYRFKQQGLLRQALTHSSYANERHMKALSDNERLEFLGDAVLELISSDFLFLGYENKAEGDLTRLRASIVCEPTLALCAKQLGLGDFLFLGKGEERTGGRMRKSILSDALEAVIGAIYLDGGFASAKEFVLTYIMTDIEHKQLFYDSKTILQEVVQEKRLSLSYRLIGESGPDHEKRFEAEVWIGDEAVARGAGSTKKGAEQDAAYQALMKIRDDAKE